MAREELLLSPRGRLDIRTLARRPGLDIPVPCRFDDHTADIPINRLCKAAMRRVVRMAALQPVWRRRLQLQLHEFDDVGPLRSFDWTKDWTPAPMERHYETAVHLSRVILQGGTLADRFGHSSSTSFLLNMNTLFEDYVTRQIRSALPDLEVAGQDHVTLGSDGTVHMRPDIAVKRGGVPIGVADCKYKLLEGDLARGHDYYQALAYATAYGLDEAWLIYARHDGDTSMSDVPVRNSGVCLRCVGLDLTVEIEMLNEQLATVAYDMVSNLRAFA